MGGGALISAIQAIVVLADKTVSKIVDSYLHI
jgi:hypothetical protein